MFMMPENTVQNVRTAMENGTFFACSRNARLELGADFKAQGDCPLVTRVTVDTPCEEEIIPFDREVLPNEAMEPGEEHIPDGFQAQSLWKRALVIFAGPLFSFILAVPLFQLIGVVWGFHDGSKTLNKVLMVSPRTVAARIGLRAGDEILKINDRRVTDGSQMIDGAGGNDILTGGAGVGHFLLQR